MVTRGFQGVQRVPRDYRGEKGLQDYRKLYIGLQKVSGGFKGLHRLQVTTKASRATKGFKGLRRVTRGYKW